MPYYNSRKPSFSKNNDLESSFNEEYKYVLRNQF